MLKRTIMLAAAAMLLSSGSAVSAQTLGGGGGCGGGSTFLIIPLGNGATKTIYPDGSYVVTQQITDQNGNTYSVVTETGWGPPPEAEVNC